MADKFSIPEEPTDVKRVVTTDGSRQIFTRSGPGYYDEWVSEDGSEYSWVDLLSEFGEVREIVAPTEAIEFLKRYDVSPMRLFRDAPANELEKHLADIVEFAEALS